MNRLPPLRKDELAPDRRAVYDEICRVRGSDSVDERGGLAGPFNAFVHAPPEIGHLLIQLTNALNFRTGLDLRRTELAILTVGAHWKSEFEWWGHARRALDAGLPASVVDAIAEGRRPPLDDATDLVVYGIADQLVRTGRVDSDTYAAAVDVLDEATLVGLVSICGHYTMISFILNAFDVSLPPGIPSRWDA